MGLSRRVARAEQRSQRTAPPPACEPASPPLTGEGLAERLGVSGETIRRWSSEGMPSCGTYPGRAEWPVYDESVCRLWAAANQPGTVLKPPAAQSTAGAAGLDIATELARERLRSLRLHNEKLEQAVRERGGKLLDADEVRATVARMNTTLRLRFEALPARATPRILCELRVSQADWAVVQAVLDDEVRQVIQEIYEDPFGKNLPGAPGAGADAGPGESTPERR